MSKKKRHDPVQMLQAIRSWYEQTTAPMAEKIAEESKDPFKVLVSIVLSARTKDTITEKVVPKLFQKYPSMHSLAKADELELQQVIYPIGFYKNKAKQLIQLSRVLLDKYKGVIPREKKDLMSLPGVGRKTANLYLAVIHGDAEICVDTHVHRISNRLGWVKTKTPLETELALQKLFPKQYWNKINGPLVRFGQEICLPRNPKCNSCPVQQKCPRINVA